jgi:hypothetical protein
MILDAEAEKVQRSEYLQRVLPLLQKHIRSDMLLKEMISNWQATTVEHRQQ